MTFQSEEENAVDEDLNVKQPLNSTDTNKTVVEVEDVKPLDKKCVPKTTNKSQSVKSDYDFEVRPFK